MVINENKWIHNIN